MSAYNNLHESIEDKSFSIDAMPMFIRQTIANNKTPLSNVIDKTLIEKAVERRVAQICSDFSDDITEIPIEKIENKLNKLLEICAKKEEPIREQLEQLCYNTLVKLFNIPADGIYYTNKLVDEINPGFLFHIQPNYSEQLLSENEALPDDIDMEVDKRKLINALIMGASMTLLENSRPLYINELFAIDEDLPHLYSKIIKLNNYLIHLKKIPITDKQHFQGGYTIVTLGDNTTNTKIEVKGINFPILLHETIKGFLELIASHGLPSNLDIARKVIDCADNTKDEPWHMRIGPVLWDDFISDFNVSSQEMPYIFQILVKQKPEKFFRIFNELIYDGENKENLLIKITDAAMKRQQEDSSTEFLQPSDEKTPINDNTIK